MTFPVTNKDRGDGNQHDALSLALNCKKWQLYIIFNSQTIHKMKMKRNESRNPVIICKEFQPFELEWQVIEMKCELISENKNRNYKSMKEVDKYIFVSLEDRRKFQLLSKY